MCSIHIGFQWRWWNIGTPGTSLWLNEQVSQREQNSKIHIKARKVGCNKGQRKEKVTGFFFFFPAKNEDSRGLVQKTVLMSEAGARPGPVGWGMGLSQSGFCNSSGEAVVIVCFPSRVLFSPCGWDWNHLTCMYIYFVQKGKLSNFYGDLRWEETCWCEINSLPCT